MNQKPKRHLSKDTSATRKKRLQERLQEISDKSEQELNALLKSLDKVKMSFRSSNDKES